MGSDLRRPVQEEYWERHIRGYRERVQGCRRTILIVGTLPDSLVTLRGHLIEALSARGYRVIACGARQDSLSGISGMEGTAELKRRGAEYAEYPVDRTGRNPLADLRTLAALVALCRRHRPDVMLAYTAKAVVWGLLAGWMTGVSKRFALMTGLAFGLSGGEGKGRAASLIARGLFSAALSRATGVLFHNVDDERALKKKGLLAPDATTGVVNGSGVDLSQFRAAALPSGQMTFLLIARLLREKGVMEYLEAARRVKSSAQTIEFLLAGPIDPHPDGGGEWGIRRWEGDGIGTWLGALADVRPALARCSVYVLPSYHEGTARTVIEAMATGRPIITTDAPGCRETVIPGENGFLVPVKDVDALAEAMRRFASDPAMVEPMGARSRTLAETRYDVHSVNAKMIAFMEEGDHWRSDAGEMQFGADRSAVGKEN